MLDPAICDNGTVIPNPTDAAKVALVAECKILVAIRNALDPNGDQFSDWNAASPMEGGGWGSDVSVSAGGGTPYLFKLRLNGHLRNGRSGIEGSIPSVIGGLTRLKHLTIIDAPNITGPIPAAVGSMSALEELLIDDTGMSGSIPTELGNLSNLKKLSLVDNYFVGSDTRDPRPGFTGSIPSELGNLANLERLWLYTNRLTGSIPTEFGDLDKVTSLNLRGNKLSGSIPAALGDMDALTTLHLWDNELTGSIPSEINNLNLVTLSLKSNNLSGAIPDLTSLPIANSALSLSDNQFTGDLATTLSRLPTSVIYLDLSSNKLTGSIPATITVPFISLDVSDNDLSGPIPAGLGSLSTLIALNLRMNDLDGSIPTELGNLQALRALRLNDNELTGQIPLELEGLNSLSRLYLADNKFTGCLPAGLHNVAENDLALLLADEDLDIENCGAAPVFDAQGPITLDVREDAAVGTVIGMPITATDPDGDTLTYSVSGRGDTWITVDTATGQLKVSGALNYEEFPSLSVTVGVTDNKDAFNGVDSTVDDTVKVTIMVVDVNEPPIVLETIALEINDVEVIDERSVQENDDEPIGSFVADDPEGDPITWSAGGADGRLFKVNSMGQLFFKSSPDFEQPTDNDKGNTYDLEIVASDDGQEQTAIEIHVTVTDVDEAPIISGDRVVDYLEGATEPVATYSAADPEGQAVTLSMTGRHASRFSLVDGTLSFLNPPDFEDSSRPQDGVYSVDLVATDGTYSRTRQVLVPVRDANEAPVFGQGGESISLDESTSYQAAVFVHEYAAQDPEGDAIDWSLTGPDAALFAIDTSGSLSFVVGPDFEAPADRGRDNVYDVTVEASDLQETASLPITVTVNNVEEAGQITASQLYPKVGTRLTLHLDDPDGGISGLTWNWELNSGSGFAQLPDATSSSYTPAAGDAGGSLRATASYDDALGLAKSAVFTASAVVEAATSTNNAPAFDSTAAQRTVPENSDVDTLIGSPVSASDADSDFLTYRISGTGVRYVSIGQSSGQLSVRVPPDHETTPTLRVEVTATDPTGARATQRVTITVTDVDEAPTLTGLSTVDYPETSSRAVARYSVRNAQGRDIRRELTGVDASQFEITSDGVLQFVDVAHDYENPLDDGGDNVYDLIVEAVVGDSHTLTQVVTVTVTNEDEAGTVTLSKNRPEPDDTVSATLLDPDGGVQTDQIEWEWQRSTDGSDWTPIPDVTDTEYTVAEHDRGYQIRAVAVYSDAHGFAKSAASDRTADTGTPPDTGSGGTSSGGTSSGGTSSGGGGSGGGGGGGDLDVGVATFVVANGWSPADVGVAAVLAARTSDAVVVYTAGDELSAETAMLLRDASPAEVIIVGGTAAVSRDVRTQIRAASSESGISRVTGADRADTAAGTARRILGVPSQAGRVTLIVANGWSPPDIGAAAALAARSGRSAVVYTQAARLPEASAALLRDYQVARVILIGGTAAISAEVAAQATAAAGSDASISRLTGADRVDTAAQTARRVLGNAASAPDGITLVIANGWSAPDVGVAAALAAATENAAVAYTSQGTLPAATAELIRDYRPSQVIIVGGRAAVTNEVRAAITEAAPSSTDVRRITGTTRTDTAARAARRILGSP